MSGLDMPSSTARTSSLPPNAPSPARLFNATLGLSLKRPWMAHKATSLSLGHALPEDDQELGLPCGSFLKENLNDHRFSSLVRVPLVRVTPGCPQESVNESLVGRGSCPLARGQESWVTLWGAYGRS